MDPVSPFPAIASVLMAVATCFFLVNRFGAPTEQERYATIDGLRGYLAIFVFLCHSSMLYFYLRTGQMKLPPSNLYTQFGQGSVTIFFMITGFLFFSKLIDGRARKIDWGRLFISRFLRLVPLYLFAMLLLFLIVAYVSHGDLNEPISKLLKGAVRWLGFTILGLPDLNGIENTYIIVAGVTWSLPYEWLFYFALPLLALTVRVMPPLPYVALGIASVAGFTTIAWLGIWHPQIHHLMSFLGGIMASLLVRFEFFQKFAIGRVSSGIILVCLAVAVAFYPSPDKAVPLFLLSVVFVLVACGNNMFGVLTHPVSRTLGQMTYSIYLLHGITLYVTFNFILGVTEARALSSVSHWLLVIGITPILVFVCFVTFRLIENPAMRSTTNVTAWLRSRLTNHTSLS
jgi:peptidoglycan/LPS O-acetylase OafA/YrhL